MAFFFFFESRHKREFSLSFSELAKQLDLFLSLSHPTSIILFFFLSSFSFFFFLTPPKLYTSSFLLRSLLYLLRPNSFLPLAHAYTLVPDSNHLSLDCISPNYHPFSKMTQAHTINPSRRTTAVPETKKLVPNWHLLVRPPMSDANPRKSNLEKTMEEDLAELRIAMDHFLNNRMNEAEEMLRCRHKPESMYYQFGKALCDALKAILTFHPDDIEKAMRSFDLTLKVTNKQRKTSSVAGLGTVKALGSWVVGSIGAGAFKGMTRIEKHAVRYPLHCDYLV